MGPLERKLRSQNIEPTSVEFWKYISKKYPKKEEKEKADESSVNVSENPMPSTSSSSTTPVPLPLQAESPLTTQIEEIHSPMTTDDEIKEKEQEDVPMNLISTANVPSTSLSFGTSISWLKSIKSSIRRRMSHGEEEPENRKRKLFIPEIVDIDDSGPDTERTPPVASEAGPSTSPNKKHKVSTDNFANNSELTKTHDVIDLESEPDSLQQPTPLATPPSLASSAAEAVRQSSQMAAPLKSTSPPESELLRMQVLKLQSELSQMGTEFNRLLEKLNNR